MGEDAFVVGRDRSYRLVERPGLPHPCLDDLYDSFDAALGEAQSWWQGCGGGGSGCTLGVEVSTRRGEWRTLRLLPCPLACLLSAAAPSGCAAQASGRGEPS